MEKNNKVLLGMSGGTDSSVAAILLKDSGYDVTGITLRFYEKNNDTEYLSDAKELCDRLGIKHLVYDVRSEFREYIIRYFIEEYMSGRTPVPCTLCNNYLKWPVLKKVADLEGIYNLATGHYVQKKYINGFWHILSGSDSDKDQSFFLWGLPQDILKRMILPLGNISKNEVRKIACDRGFHKISVKKDSLGVCFCPMDYRNFLMENVVDRIEPGFYMDEMNNVIGKHMGYPFYTIGQRRGLGIHLNKALFVKEIYPDKNIIVLSDNLKSLERNELFLSNWNIVNSDILLNNPEVIIKIRYRKQANKCVVTLSDNGYLHVKLIEPLTSVANGQAAAFYDKNILLGGGIIESSC